jgi:hypothetical protein
LIPPPAKRFQPRWYRGDWSGHLPFAHDIVAALQPRLLVELGTQSGESYFGFCQAVAENGLACRCYAVDSGQRDVFQELASYNDANYGAFSSFLQTTFDRAAEQFDGETVDLLHIDGLNTYEEARSAFNCWMARVRPGGIILAHDTVALNSWWKELRQQYPSFEFTHAGGLGVLRKPGREAVDSDFVRSLFSGTSLERSLLQHYYAMAADALSSQHELRTLQTERLAAIAAYKHACGAQHELLDQLEEFKRALATEHDQRIALEQEISTLRTAVHLEWQGRTDVLSSYSWKVTAPLRKIFNALHSLGS